MRASSQYGFQNGADIGVFERDGVSESRFVVVGLPMAME